MGLLKDFIYRAKLRYLKAGEYYKVAQKKDLIVLHFTAGYGVGEATAEWFDMQKGAIATAVSTSADGTVVSLFDAGYWAWHLGSTEANEKRSIGNEICSLGALWLKKGVYFDAYGRVYNGDVVTLPQPWRGVKYFAKLSDKQYEETATWAARMCIIFNIEPKVCQTHEFIADNANLKGIAYHSNFRLDKYDMSPAFDIKRFEALFTEAYANFKQNGLKQ